MTTKINGNQIQLGGSADPTKNFIISVPATPDGTLTIKRENGTVVFKVEVNGTVTIPGGINP